MRIEVVGIGAGDPDQITVQAVAVLGRVDVVFLLDKADAAGELMALREALISRYAPQARIVRGADPDRDRVSPGYTAAVDDWRTRRADVCAEMVGELGPDEVGAFLVWGDPSLYDSVIAVLEDVRSRGTDFELGVVPGISSVSALAAKHATTLNQVGGAVQITTGRRLASGWPDGVDDLVVMLDAQCAFLAYPDAEIRWGAYVSTPDEILISGRVSEVGERIRREREAARASKGWIMDTYLLRRPR
ncbi:precorrin-6A synthase (deacetylating) [Actinokineospora fastidiosa]|uniref:Precorrin-6A synthase (Deacetylating) n=1 Tax=Actinokineospora fastidiosa TaxID=1816 RepID=A0A918LGM5_9PSEU|nr:precorrin-6A synthase (deacetylating) [Actinokineospora fastidiosa]GGS47576.1 precorrin-6A synthase (deacetylating) [Actinokineospora fastidiosa]